jgi:hypothetical protein
MKARLNISIDQDLLTTIKAHAMRNDTSISELVESYFRVLALKQLRRSNLLDMVEKLNIPPIDPKRDLIKEYYEARTRKYGHKSVPRRKRNS